MARKEKLFYYIYKTTNLKNGKYYFGMHSTDNLNDGYLGSGKYLRRSIKKYGAENFSLEILEFLPNKEMLKNREKELITDEHVQNKKCMNLKIGGEGGWTLEQQKNGAKLTHSKIWNDEEFIERTKKRGSERFKKLWADGKITNWPWPKGKPLADDTKEKIGKANSLLQKGEKNSQYGTCWITDGIKNKKRGYLDA